MKHFSILLKYLSAIWLQFGPELKMHITRGLAVFHNCIEVFSKNMILYTMKCSKRNSFECLGRRKNSVLTMAGSK